MRPVGYVIAALLGAVLVWAVQARAIDETGPLAGPYVIPYHGALELDGIPVTGQVSFRFTLFDQQSGGAQVWTDDMTIDVYGGQFSALLGSGTNAMPATAFSEEALWLQIELEDASMAGSFITLANRQRITPVPHSYVASEAPDDFEVTNDLSVGGGLDVTGSSALRSGATIIGAENNGSSAAISIQTTGGSQVMLLDGNEIDGVSGLFLNGNVDEPVSANDTLVIYDPTNNTPQLNFRNASGDTGEMALQTVSDNLEIVEPEDSGGTQSSAGGRLVAQFRDDDIAYFYNGIGGPLLERSDLGSDVEIDSADKVYFGGNCDPGEIRAGRLGTNGTDQAAICVCVNLASSSQDGWWCWH